MTRTERSRSELQGVALLLTFDALMVAQGLVPLGTPDYLP